MKSSNAIVLTVGAVLTVLLAGNPCGAQEHAVWPANWNSWSDPVLWANVDNRGNIGEISGAAGGQGAGPQAFCGAVDYRYRISKFEVTAGQYAAFLNAVAKTDAYGLYNSSMDTAVEASAGGCNIKRDGSPGNYSYSVAEDWANRPVNWVSWGDAARFCNWLTKGKPEGEQNASTTEDGSYLLNGATTAEALQAVVRKSPQDGGQYYIPTEDEWYKAAYHANDEATGNYFDYPTGSNSAPSNVLVDPDGGNSANFLGSEYTIDAPYYRSEAGEFENSRSPYGTFDQGGNVREWNEAVILTDNRGMRAGSFDSNADSLRADHRDIYGLPTAEDRLTGFRIVEVPEPASMAIMVVGGIAVLMRRRRGLRD
jgi:formylglycine-generating enzyme required for sulfatase activity